MAKSETLDYAIVIPAKDEEECIGVALQSVIDQTYLPRACLVVDDGSIDDTKRIVEQIALAHPFVHYTHIESKGEYRLGGHVVSVFEYGRRYLLDTLSVQTDYVVKMDADLEFSQDHFEQIAHKISDGKWGVVSGNPYLLEDGVRINDNSPEWHSQGQLKVYNTAFLNSIEGIPRSLGWDTADNVIAIDLGWKTATFRDIPYKMARSVGGKHSLARGRTKHGRGCFLLGYSTLYFGICIIHDLIKPPVIVGTFSMITGYVSAFISGEERILNKQQRKLLRGLLWKSLWTRLRKKEFLIFQLLNRGK